MSTHRPSRQTPPRQSAPHPPITSLGPRLAQPIITPLRNLGRDISHLTGWSVFAGPLGWVFTGLLVLAIAMITAAFALGHRRSSATRS